MTSAVTGQSSTEITISFFLMSCYLNNLYLVAQNSFFPSAPQMFRNYALKSKTFLNTFVEINIFFLLKTYINHLRLGTVCDFAVKEKKKLFIIKKK